MTNGIEAGNTAETLKAIPVEEAAKSGLPSAADLDAVEAEKQIAEETVFDTDEPVNLADLFVTREEFDELLAKIAKYNLGASHKI